MTTTRMFKSGNSQAVRLPAGIAYADPGIELSIVRCGDVITIYPAGRKLSDAVAILRQMPKPATIEVREPIEVPVRAAD